MQFIIVLIYLLSAASSYGINFKPAEHPCLRKCSNNEPSMKCNYKFIIERYQSLSRACYDCPKNTTDCFRPDCVAVDGTSRTILVANRQLPGPSIEVCQNDEIIVDVENRLSGEETTIHWHGQHQYLSPYMDGVPYVTQCPIASGTSFRYRFIAVTTGTQFWHSHSGNQRGDGLFGPLIVRNRMEAHSIRYDYDLSEHVIIVHDWMHEMAMSKFTYRHHSSGLESAESLLVNGHGYFKNSTHLGGVPPTTFHVTHGSRYRFRVINAGFLNCPIEISIDNHTLTVISTDGFDVEPREVDSIVIYTGERFDFILNANQNISNYWMRFRGMLSCGERRTKAHQVAVLNYAGVDAAEYPAGFPDYPSSHNKDGWQLNPMNEDMFNDKSIKISELHSLAADDMKPIPDYQFYIHYDFYNITNPHFYRKDFYEYNKAHPKFNYVTPMLNHIALTFQPFPLLPRRDLITPDMFCNATTVENCKQEFCQCTHVLQVKLNAEVELIVIDTGFAMDGNHPFHLHGNAFRVVALDRLGTNVTVAQVKELDRLGLIKRKLNKAPIKDTVTISDGGYTVMRFRAYNPGYWLFHCHIDFHAEVGMALIFKVGEHSDMAPVPDNFPHCGNWLPNA